jgi:hypothetical protein
VFLPDRFNQALDLSRYLGVADPKITALVMFLILAAILLWVGTRKKTGENGPT